MVPKPKYLMVVLALAATAVSIPMITSSASAHNARPTALVSSAAALDDAEYPPPLPSDPRDIATLVDLRGSAVVPGPGSEIEANTSGGGPYGGPLMLIQPNVERNEVCFSLGSMQSWEQDEAELGPVTSVQIHSGTPGEAGPVVLTLQRSETGDDPVRLEGCAGKATQRARKHVSRHSEEITGSDLYAEVDTTEFPNGSVRADLRESGRDLCSWLCSDRGESR